MLKVRYILFGWEWIESERHNIDLWILNNAVCHTSKVALIMIWNDVEDSHLP